MRLGRRTLLSLAAASAVASGCRHVARPPPIQWVRSVDEADAISSRHPTLSHRPLFRWFGATWDTASKELEESTFSDSAVRMVVNERYIPVAIDCSDDEQPGFNRMRDRFKMTGTPMILTFTPHFAQEVVRITEFVTPTQLLAKLA